MVDRQQYGSEQFGVKVDNQGLISVGTSSSTGLPLYAVPPDVMSRSISQTFASNVMRGKLGKNDKIARKLVKAFNGIHTLKHSDWRLATQGEVEQISRHQDIPVIKEMLEIGPIVVRSDKPKPRGRSAPRL